MFDDLIRFHTPEGKRAAQGSMGGYDIVCRRVTLYGRDPVCCSCPDW